MTADDEPSSASPLLGPDEPPAVEVVNSEGGGSAVLVCDHAVNRVPRRLGTLGLEPDQLAAHIGWDPGAAEVAHRFSKRLDSPLVLSGYSRLVIDCNRPPGSEESIPKQSAGVPIPGNHGLNAEARALRLRGLFEPYHRAIAQVLDARAGRPTLLLSIHSFTPALDGRQRPWPLGVSCWRDCRLSGLLRGALARGGELVVGDNEPYPIEEAIDYTIPVHGEGRGLPSAMIEIRQDGIRTAAEAAAWANRLAEAYRLIEGEALGLVATSSGSTSSAGPSR